MDAWGQAQGRPDERVPDAPTKPALLRCEWDRGRPTFRGHMAARRATQARPARASEIHQGPLAARPLVAVRGVT